MNTERSISLSSLLSLTCWIAGTVVAICNLFTDHLDLGAVAGAGVEKVNAQNTAI